MVSGAGHALLLYKSLSDKRSNLRIQNLTLSSVFTGIIVFHTWRQLIFFNFQYMGSNCKYVSCTLLVLMTLIFAASSCHKNTMPYDPVIFELTTTNTKQVPKTIFNVGDTIALNFSMRNVTNENLYLDRDFMRNILHFFEIFKIDTVNGVVKDTSVGEACFPLLDLRYWALSPHDLNIITASIPSSVVDSSLISYCLSNLNKGKYYVTFSTSFSLMKNTITRDPIKTRLYNFHIRFEIK